MIHTRLHFILILFAMIACGSAWVVGYRTFAVNAAGSATFGAAFLCTQFRTERGVWMGGALLLVILLPQLASGLMVIAGIPSPVDDSMPAAEIIDYGIGSTILTAFFAFAIYATVVNFCLFPPVASCKEV
ncbi:hypothetical protein [Rhodopirellula bahusiensis]|uniref:Uncharacterized protein n=1 Tax=Rhodopirellula bahusiensis TaxID=2014065 RepID=A0A2G1W213_9BACT|nr:hypothetical protein [Rhodopirellula bahusiensis]PHQ33066.1 hypothetical protein CEE69_22900 [Rhodopirellula bahusiensis]